ncbi:esterase/lipase family protein [Nocardia neocaledoniensis]|uniref:esterase/lipase family protein n=1 Tax=Nocardia neocaledoniensis TaxID=236511 RepID=UPI002454588C|nr:alpha/beta fold hydrolase [Nocardia neocaledoniensis]
MIATTHPLRRTLCGLGIAAGLAAASVLGSGPAGAEPPLEPTVESLAAYLDATVTTTPDGRRPTAIADTGSASGSSSGSAGSRSSDAIGEGPEMSAYLPAFAYGLLHPDAAPPGANRWDCKPTAEHPRPVVLLHGTWLNAYDTFSYLSPRLAKAGHCVFTLNFGKSGLLEGGGLGAVLPGRYGVGPMADSSRQVAAFIERVRAATGAEQVDIVGHSQGGTIANHYLKFEGGQGKVGKLVTFGATHHGTSLMGIASLGRLINNAGIDILGFYRPIIGVSNVEQAVGSSFYATLNAAGDTVPGVAYTVVGSRYDEVMNPLDWTFLRAGPDATVDNITLQDGCEQDVSDHLTMMYSPRAASLALRALDPTGSPEVACTFNPWFFGGGGSL